MGAGYSISAFDYNKDDIGIDPDTKMKFVPNQKEIELFKKVCSYFAYNNIIYRDRQNLYI